VDYIDFELEISPGRDDSFSVAVLRSPAGEPRASLQLPWDERDVQLKLIALENALLRSGATHTRRILSPDDAPVQAIGEGLFRALLNGDVLGCYDQSQRAAREQHKGLRLKLRVQSPELAALPWEYLYDPREDEYIGLSRRTPIVRYMEPRQPVPPLKVQPPLRILGLVASPSDLDLLDISAERQRVEGSLKELRTSGLLELVWLPGQTWADLQTAIWQGPWHIFHFIGHGGFDAERDEGVIALCSEAGTKRLLTATELGRLLGDHDSLRLAVLNACEGARGGRRDVFSSTAAMLVRRGVPAVVAMQYEISDGAAIEFGTRFYAAVAHGMSVDGALAEARISMSVATRESAEWGTPVLYTNAPDGQLFDLESVPPQIPQAPRPGANPQVTEQLEQLWRQALSYFWTDKWDEAAQLLSQIVAQQPQYQDAAAKLACFKGSGPLRRSQV
jgi:hypothetical protein